MELAINGGRKVRAEYMPDQLGTIDREEIHEVVDVMRKKLLSKYRGNFSENFWGGEKVQDLEKAFSKKFNIHYSLAVNSCTSGLHIACQAIGLQPGDEVIVTPWSMSCSATAPMLYGAIPVFADIDPKTFCLDPESVKAQITDKTKAIIYVDLFGYPMNPEIRDIADDHNIFLIEDAAQAIGSFRNYLHVNGEENKTQNQVIKPRRTNKQYAGTTADIGVFSFTQGKHLTSGEGGMIITDDPQLNIKCAMIRNHAEAVCNDMDVMNKIFYSELLGFNMRMTEIQAAIIIEQLKKLDGIVVARRFNAKYLYGNITSISGISDPYEKENNEYTNSYYCQPFLYDETIVGIPRDKFINAVKAELTEEKLRPDRGVAIGNGYIKPLYLFPIFQERKHWSIRNETKISYEKGTCPVAERLYEKELFVSLLHSLELNQNDITDISNAFKKVYKYRKEIGRK